MKLKRGQNQSRNSWEEAVSLSSARPFPRKLSISASMVVKGLAGSSHSQERFEQTYSSIWCRSQIVSLFRPPFSQRSSSLRMKPFHRDVPARDHDHRFSP